MATRTKNDSLDKAKPPFSLWKVTDQHGKRRQFAWVWEGGLVPSWDDVKRLYGAGHYELRDSAKLPGRSERLISAEQTVTFERPGHRELAPPAPAAVSSAPTDELQRILQSRDAEVRELRAELARVVTSQPNPMDQLEAAIAQRDKLNRLFPVVQAEAKDNPPAPTILEQIASLGELEPGLRAIGGALGDMLAVQHTGKQWAAVRKAAESAGLTASDVIGWIAEHVAGGGAQE